MQFLNQAIFLEDTKYEMLYVYANSIVVRMRRLQGAVMDFRSLSPLFILFGPTTSFRNNMLLDQILLHQHSALKETNRK